MKREQVQQLLTVGSILQFTAADRRAGPLTWAGIRMRDGLAVCTEPLPQAIDEDPAVRGWMQGRGRRWLFVQDAAPGWCFTDWHAGHGEPDVTLDSTQVLEAGGDDLLLLVAAACQLACDLYPGWEKYERTEAVDLEVVAIYPVQVAKGTVQAEA